MSHAATGWAYEQRFGSSAKKLVFLVLAEHHNKETGTAWPSVARMAAIAECDERTVKKALKELVEDGQLEDTGSRTGQAKNVVIWRLPKFEAHFATINVSPYKNEGAGSNSPESATQPADTPNKSGDQTTGNGQPLQICRGSAETGNSAPTNLQVSPLIFVPAAPTNLGGESSLKNPLLTSGGDDRRASPTGSPVAPDTKSDSATRFEQLAEKDAVSRDYWWRSAVSLVFGMAHLYGCGKFGCSNWDGLSDRARALMPDLCKALAVRAVTAENDIPPAKRWVIEKTVTDAIVAEFKSIRAATPSERASAAA